MKSSLSKLTRWFCFTVTIAILPLIAAFLTLVTYSRPFDLKAVSEHGELLLIATAIGGAAIGEMIGPRTHRWVLRKLICAGATLFLVLTSAIWFGIIASGFGTINSDVVAYGSLALLIFTVLSSGACVALSEV